MSIKSKDLKLIVGLFIPLLISLGITESLFSYKIPSATNISPDVLSVLLALSGIIFAFQPIIIRAKHILFKVAFPLQAFFVGAVGYDFISDSLKTGTFSGYTLWLASFSLFLNISFSVYFVIVGLAVETEK